MQIEDVTTWEDFAAEAKRLIGLERDAEVRRYEWLALGEATPRLWESAGLTYPALLERAGLADPAKYVGFKRARERFSVEEILALGGVDGAIRASRLPSDEERREVLADARAFAERNDAPPSERSVQSIVRDVAARRVTERLGPEASTRASLEDEVRRLREENRQLREENRLLRAELNGKRSKREPKRRGGDARPS